MPSTLKNVWYDIGDRIKLSVTIRDLEADDALIDPDVLVFTMLEPDLTSTSYTFGVDSQVVHDSLGLFHVNWTATQDGVHWSRFVASGNVGAAEELGFKVRASKVLA